MAAHHNFYDPGPLPATVAVVIPPGGSAEVAATLQKDGATSHPLLFRAAAWLTRKDGPLHAGEYLVPARASLADILHILRHGLPVQHQVTFPEGLTSAQIAKILNTTPAASGTVAPPPQGAVLPQTYDFVRGEPRQAILARAAKAMRQKLATAWAGRDTTVPLASAQQALILASIVQAESPEPAEFPEIAAVYENRLAKGMKLQADPTVIFASSAGETSGGVPISRTDLTNPSPYNTYAHSGLPPGPICAPGLAAITAVLHPAASKALYFVATGHGGHVFSDSFQGQLKNIEVYRESQKENPGTRVPGFDLAAKETGSARGSPRRD
ncbi:MAG: aminodeoxychorismate lyase [Acidocella sp. 20-61-6]|nr:MAG: aminodeoxychorismate lyase [Acidocella sp. 20-61-6]